MPSASASARRSSMPPRESRPTAMRGSSGCTGRPSMARTSLMTCVRGIVARRGSEQRPSSCSLNRAAGATRALGLANPTLRLTWACRCSIRSSSAMASRGLSAASAAPSSASACGAACVLSWAVLGVLLGPGLRGDKSCSPTATSMARSTKAPAPSTDAPPASQPGWSWGPNVAATWLVPSSACWLNATAATLRTQVAGETAAAPCWSAAG